MVLDLVVLFITVFSIFIGTLRGGIRETFLLLGWGVAFSFPDIPELFLVLTYITTSVLIQKIIVFFGTLLIFFFIGHLGRYIIRGLGCGLIDMYGGTMMGACKSIVFSYFLLGSLYLFNFITIQDLQASTAASYMIEIANITLPWLSGYWGSWVMVFQIL